jgi:hypothetical protein
VADLTRLFGHTAGGRPAERLIASLGLPQGDDTILRSLKRHVRHATKQWRCGWSGVTSNGATIMGLASVFDGEGWLLGRGARLSCCSIV